MKGRYFFVDFFSVIVAISLALSGCAPLTSSYTVSGHVLSATDGITGIPGVSVTLEESGAASATTGADGSYTISGVPCGAFKLTASLAGKTFFPQLGDHAGSDTFVLRVDENGISRADLLGIDSNKVTISMIQGRSMTSAAVGQSVSGVKGIVTMVTRQRQNGSYTVTDVDGSTDPQWVDYDGFFMEAIPAENDGDPATSDGIFVLAHDTRYSAPAWSPKVPTLKPGDVVTVSGVVREFKPVDRFGNCQNFLTVTRIEDATVSKVVMSVPFPAGVWLTYSETALPPSGVTEKRVLPWDRTDEMALMEASTLLESVESMMVRVDNPTATSCTYYGVTGVLADGGKKDGAANPDYNSTWGSVVLKSVDDFNSELLFTNYQAPDWSTFTALPEVGDTLKDSSGAAVLRGVMEYDTNAIYWIRPFVAGATPVLDKDGNTIRNQGYGFNRPLPAYTETGAWGTLNESTWLNISNSNGGNGLLIHDWRIGSKATFSKLPSTKFMPIWDRLVSGNVTDRNLRIASFNIENYENQGTAYDKVGDIANIIANNLKAPDVLVVVEMGDDRGSAVVYLNQDNSYSVPDGAVVAVRNFLSLINALELRGFSYDYREIAPEENMDGGGPGMNIRVGFLFRTDRMTFIDSGIPTNTVATTKNRSESTWPVRDKSARALQLARTETTVYAAADSSGIDRPHLTQSPGRILGSAYSFSRKPLAGEFVFKPTNETIFVIAAHLGSKSGDAPLYGETQPPVFGSDAKRALQAKLVNDFVTKLLSIDSDARIVVAGDMNDFQFTPSIMALTGESSGRQKLYSPSQEFMPATEQFSYSYRGNLQQIDHIFVSESLYNGMNGQGTTDWRNVAFIPHVDSLFSDNNHVSNSDHDPVTVKIPR